ncbi:MAG: hypothetical protein U1B83_09100, partial [Candidatus Cloacimonadaceae bacterium]|nr:hypothetical protein [Candidatus Cloacimonadaceae bacterium]
MVLKRSLLIALMSIMIVCLSALSFDELQDAVYNYGVTDSGMTMEQINDEFKVFFFFEENPGVLEPAVELWSSFDVETAREFFEQQYELNREIPKYQWLRLFFIEDPLARINATRAMIQSNRTLDWPYKVLIRAYLENYPYDMYFEDPAPMAAALKRDLKLFIDYSTVAPGDENALLAAIFYHLESGDPEAAKAALESAYALKASWLEEFDFARLMPMSKFHGILRHYVDLLLADEAAEDREYTIQQAAEYLVDYYFETLKDYPVLVELMQDEPVFLDSYYFRYVLVSSYYHLGELSKPAAIIADPMDYLDSKAFQDIWINFDRAEAEEVYQAILKQRQDNPVARYIYIRSISDDASRLAEIRKLLQDSPKDAIAFELISEYYWRYFSHAPGNDPARQQMLDSFRQDKKHLEIYYIRYMKEPQALRAMLLVNILQANDSRALDNFKKLPFNEISVHDVRVIDKIVADTGNTSLLMLLKEDYITRSVEAGFIETADLEKNIVLGYCDALYSSGNGPLLLTELENNPHWWNYSELQYMMVNYYYYQNDFAETIRVLSFMVQQGNIGATVLKSLDGTPLSQHPDWIGLIEYAETMPDPSQEEDSEDLQYEDIDDPDTGMNDPARGEMPAPGDDYQDTEEPDGETGTGSGIIGKPAPQWMLKNIKGYDIALTDYPGATIILDFWASWCGPC